MQQGCLQQQMRSFEANVFPFQLLRALGGMWFLYLLLGQEIFIFWLQCGMWDSRPSIKPMLPALGVESQPLDRQGNPDKGISKSSIWLGFRPLRREQAPLVASLSFLDFVHAIGPLPSNPVILKLQPTSELSGGLVNCWASPRGF